MNDLREATRLIQSMRVDIAEARCQIARMKRLLVAARVLVVALTVTCVVVVVIR